MKIPLEQDPFPPVTLTPNQELQLKWLSDAVLDETLVENDDFVFTQKRVLNRDKWKHVMSREKVSIFKRVGKGEELGGCTPDISLTEPGIQPRTMYWRVPSCIGVGTLPGSLDDLLYGLLAPTKLASDIRTTYIKDGIADSRVVATVVSPSEEDPLRCLVVRWNLAYQLMHKVGVTPRELVVMESMGSRVLPNGERVGYFVLQSVDIPGCGELTHLGLIRSKFSSCFVFRDTGKGSIELFMRGYVDPGGRATDTIAVLAAATTLIAAWRIMYASQNKKLAFLARNSLVNKSKREMFAKAKEVRSRSCHSCSRSFMAFRSSRCGLCQQKICSRCVEKRKLSHLSPAGKVVRVSTLVCRGCLSKATRMNARAVAACEYVENATRKVGRDSHDLKLGNPSDLVAWVTAGGQEAILQRDTITSESTVSRVDSGYATSEGYARGSILSEVSFSSSTYSSIWSSSHSIDWVDQDAESQVTLDPEMLDLFVRMNQLHVAPDERFTLTQPPRDSAQVAPMREAGEVGDDVTASSGSP